jgi:predicted solute-binding protein
VLDGIAVASLGEVKSVFLAHRHPLAEAKEIYCDPASLTSVQLLRVLLAEQGLHPEFKTLASYEPDSLPDFSLLIGNAALDFLQTTPDQTIWDLGAAWYERTHLPFVYAVWALRRGIDQAPLGRLLRGARDFGLETLDYIIAERSEYDYSLRKITRLDHYHLGAERARGLVKFIELLRKHNSAPVYDPRFI